MRPLSIALVALVATLLAADLSSAQTPRYSVEGVVHDSAGVGLPSATIVALTREDLSLIHI